MKAAPRYLLTDTFDIGMLASPNVGISITEMSLETVCELIEKAEMEQKLGLHGGWADGIRNPAEIALSPHGPILLVARPVATAAGIVMKWVKVEVMELMTG